MATIANNTSSYEEDERAPYVPIQKAIKNWKEKEDDEDIYVPITDILKQYWKEEQEKLYCYHGVKDYDHSSFYNDLYTYEDYYDYYKEASSDDDDHSIEESVDESSGDEHQYDPLDNDPIFKEAARKFAYVWELDRR